MAHGRREDHASAGVSPRLIGAGLPICRAHPDHDSVEQQMSQIDVEVLTMPVPGSKRLLAGSADDHLDKVASIT